MTEYIAKGKLSDCERHELLLKLEEAGLTDVDVQNIIQSEGNELASKVVEFIQRGSYEVAQIPARNIMGKNYLGIRESIQYLKINPTQEDLRSLEKIPFDEALLEACKDTHILVSTFPISILQIRERVGRELFYLTHNKDEGWYYEEKFACEKGEAEWNLIRKGIISDSINKTWEEQQQRLSRNEETPKARTLTYASILYNLVTGIRLYNNIWARCRDMYGMCANVAVGFDIDGRFHIINNYVDCRYSQIGLASAQKI